MPSLQLQHESSSVLLAGMDNGRGGRSLSLSFRMESTTGGSRIPRLPEFARIKTNSFGLITPKAGWSIRLSQSKVVWWTRILANVEREAKRVCGLRLFSTEETLRGSCPWAERSRQFGRIVVPSSSGGASTYSIPREIAHGISIPGVRSHCWRGTCTGFQNATCG